MMSFSGRQTISKPVSQIMLDITDDTTKKCHMEYGEVKCKIMVICVKIGKRNTARQKDVKI